MFIVIPQIVLQSRKLSGDEKILLSYVISLHKSGKMCFATEVFFQAQLGLMQSRHNLSRLSDLGHIENTHGGWRLTQEASFKLMKGA